MSSIATELEIMDLVKSLRELANHEHDDLGIADEAADIIEALWEALDERT
jgi:hypothetical protein